MPIDDDPDAPENLGTLIFIWEDVNARAYSFCPSWPRSRRHAVYVPTGWHLRPDGTDGVVLVGVFTYPVVTAQSVFYLARDRSRPGFRLADEPPPPPAACPGPEVWLPEADRHSYPDGSLVRRSTEHPGQWVAYHPRGKAVVDDAGDLRFFHSPELAGAALAVYGEGPASPKPGGGKP